MLRTEKGVSAYFYGSLPVEQTTLLGALGFILSWLVEEAELLLHHLLISCCISYLQQVQYFLLVLENKTEDNGLMLYMKI